MTSRVGASAHAVPARRTIVLKCLACGRDPVQRVEIQAAELYDYWKPNFARCVPFRLRSLPPLERGKIWLGQALQPVLDTLGIPEGKMIRCLLASMPSGCVIPVHHDTGHWVQYTHRVHVPIVTDVSQVRVFHEYLGGRRTGGAANPYGRAA